MSWSIRRRARSNAAPPTCWSTAADVLDDSSAATGHADRLRAALARARHRSDGDGAQRHDRAAGPARCRSQRATASDLAAAVNEVISSLDPSFRAQELSFAVSLIGGNVELLEAAERRTWLAAPRSAASPKACRERSPRRRSAPPPTSIRIRCGCTTACAARSGSAWPCWSPISAGCSTPSGSCSAPCRCCGRTRSTPARTCYAGWSARSPASSSAPGCIELIGTNQTAAVVPAAGGDPLRRDRSGGHLVRRRPGRVHADAGDPVQHHRAGRLARRAAAGRGHRDRLWGQPAGRAAVLAARRCSRLAHGARRGVHRQRRLPVRRGGVRDAALRRHAVPRRPLRPTTRCGLRLPDGGSTTPSAATWPSAAPSRCRWPT